MRTELNVPVLSLEVSPANRPSTAPYQRGGLAALDDPDLDLRPSELPLQT